MTKTSIFLINTLTENKTKSAGNRLETKMDNGLYLIDYYNLFLQKIFSNFTIFIMDQYENTIYNSNINIIYLKPSHNSNIGYAIQQALSYVQNDNVLILSTEIVPKKNFIINTKYSNISSISTGNIGCICDKKNNIINCFYDLDNSIIDCLFLYHKDISNIKNILQNSFIYNKYLFEIINLLVDSKQNILLNTIKDNNILLLDSIENINKLKKLKI